MSDLMNRELAVSLLKEHVQTDFLVKHCLATEVIMRTLARRMGRDEDLWGIAGLLHDLDFESTQDAPDRHGLETLRILEQKASSHPMPEDGLKAIKGHNADGLGFERTEEFEKALTASETITGLIVATALVYPDKKLSSVKVKSITKRMKEKAFARKVNRDHIRLCEEIGVPLADFATLSLEAMRSISDDLGL
ncbi:MAG: HD domain-containing protein [Planctomycetota bacterium]|jgi:putative nucleotidyltransferase with HDIG domain